MQILLNINRGGTTIMLVTHDVKVAAKQKEFFLWRTEKLLVKYS